MKRITISLEDDLYRIAKAYAQSEDISLSKAVVRMMRRGMEGPNPSGVRDDATFYAPRDPRTGFPVVDIGRPLTTEDVQRAIDGDDLRHLNQTRRSEE